MPRTAQETYEAAKTEFDAVQAESDAFVATVPSNEEILEAHHLNFILAGRKAAAAKFAKDRKALDLRLATAQRKMKLAEKRYTPPTEAVPA